VTSVKSIRVDEVAAVTDELRGHLRRVGGVPVVGDRVLGEWLAMAALLATEFAGRSRRLTVRAEALVMVLREVIGDGRVGATADVVALVDVLASEPEVSLKRAAELLGEKPDTLRRARREGRIRGRVEHGRVRIPLAAIDEYRAHRTGLGDR
jgi:hypothetical protein